MRRALLVLLALVLVGVVAAGMGLYLTRPHVPTGPLALAHASEQSFSEIERGRYLVTVADCAACHTDSATGGQPFAGGRPIETPFGIVAAPNITPDRETGIGGWSTTDFDNALQHGFAPDGHMLYPAMPYIYYSKAKRSDINAIRAYLATVTPVHHAVVADRLPFPFNIRLGMRAWNALYFRDDRFRPDPSKSDQWNRGAYLVEGLAHCGACHTPKDPLGGDKSGQALQGYSIQGWYAPNITGDEHNGIGRWSTDEIVAYLETGHNKDAAASGPMAEEIERSSSHVTRRDLEAIALYLKSLPGQSDSGSDAAAGSSGAMQAGEAIYGDRCAACHKADGSGIAGLFPALRGSAAVQSREPTSLMRVVLDGARSAATAGAPTGAAMPAFGWALQDDQIAAVLTFIRNSWGNHAPAVAAADVGTMRADLRRRAD